MTFSKASLVIRELRNKEITSLKDWIDFLIERLDNSNAKDYLSKALINRINYDEDKVVYTEVFGSTLLASISLLMNESSEDEDKAKRNIDSVLALPIKSLRNWANFIDGIESDDISYHTYHGTKGEEYENVAIILEHSFGRMNKDKFRNYFNKIQQKTKGAEIIFSDSEEEKHINSQNLLYVACTRAVKNLRVLYLDDISEIQEGIESIFGEVKKWEPRML